MKMSFLKSASIFHQPCQLVRHVTGGNLILSKKSETIKRKTLLELALRKKLQKPKKRKVIVKKISDDMEEVWLNGLNLENLKLYRKTSFGSFRRINSLNLIEKLKVLYASEFKTEKKESINSDSKITSNSTSSDAVLLEDKQLASPCMSDFLIKNMTSFPLVSAQYDESLRGLLKEEKEDFGNIDAVKFPSVTRILNETMSASAKEKLKQWKIQMIEKLGKDEFYKYQQDLLRQGAKFHECLKKYLESKEERLMISDSSMDGCWTSLENLLPDISDVTMVEESLYHPVLMYRGIVDCVASYRGAPCVIEWKKSDKAKSTLSATYDAPLQLCAYLGVLAWRKKFNEVTPPKGLVVVVYSNGAPANVFSMDEDCCHLYWKEWLRRLQTFWANKSTAVVDYSTEV